MAKGVLTRAVWWAFALTAVVASCGGSTQSNLTKCDVGSEKCACTSGGACNPGLSCASSLCVRLGDGGLTSSFEGGAGGSSSGSSTSSSGGGPGSDSGIGSSGGFTVDSGCSGTGCGVNNGCEGGAQTTLTGRAFDPAGKNPLYGAYVFVPTASPSTVPLPTITTGTHTCGSCAITLGPYVAAARTDASGSFTLTGVPSGTSVPVVVQLGKWRRTTYVNVPTACGPNKVADGAVRLPRSRSEGDMPQMALLTGGCEDLGCFLLNIGIDSSEFSAPHAGGRLDIYQGVTGLSGTTTGPAAGLTNGTAGDCTTSSCPLWSSKSALEYYDLVALSCECGETTATKPAAAMTALHDWLGEGGRVLADHFQYIWFKNSPATEFQSVATWLGSSTATASGTYAIDTTFAKGQDFAQWLRGEGLVADAGSPQISLSSIGTSVSTVGTGTKTWVHDASNNDAKLITFPTPVGGLCGQVAFSDVHATAALLATASTVPGGCTSGDLTAQEKAMEFLFFNLTGCVSSDSQPPPGPPPSG